MDLVGYRRRRVRRDRRRTTARWPRTLGIASVTAIPLSALRRRQPDRSARRRRPGTTARALLEYLETVEVERATARDRLPPAGAVGRAGPTRISAASPARIAAGARAAGRRGRRAAVGPALDRSTRIVDRRAATVDAARRGPGGDADARGRDRHQPRRRASPPRDEPPQVADQFAAHLLWMGDAAAAAGPPVLAEDRHAHGQRQRHRDQAQDRRQHAGAPGGQAPGAQRGRATATCSLDQPIAVRGLCRQPRARRLHPDRPPEPTPPSPRGTLDFALRRAGNMHWQRARRRQGRARARSRASRRAACGSPACPARASRRSPTWSRSACTRWATTPTCSTATTSATASTSDLGFTDEDRVENIRRVAEVAKLMADAGLIVLVSFISPFRAERRMARELFDAGRVRRGVRRHAAGGGRAARRQGPVRQGARRRDSATSPASTRPTKRRKRRSWCSTR